MAKEARFEVKSVHYIEPEIRGQKPATNCPSYGTERHGTDRRKKLLFYYFVNRRRLGVTCYNDLVSLSIFLRFYDHGVQGCDAMLFCSQVPEMLIRVCYTTRLHVTVDRITPKAKRTAKCVLVSDTSGLMRIQILKYNQWKPDISYVLLNALDVTNSQWNSVL